MKSIPIVLDRLLSNPSFERIDGKLLKVAEDGSRIILELSRKKLRTLMGPFAEAEWHLLADKAIVAFVKEGETTKVFDLKQIPREQKAKATAAGTSAPSKRATTARKAESTSSVPVKWKKYAEGRMIGEPVKLANMEKGFGMESDVILRIMEHVGIPYLPITKSIAYLDFRKFFHYVCEPGFKTFLNGQGPLPPVKIAKPVEVDPVEEVENEEGAEEMSATSAGASQARPTQDRDFRSNVSKWKKSSTSEASTSEASNEEASNEE